MIVLFILLVLELQTIVFASELWNFFKAMSFWSCQSLTLTQTLELNSVIEQLSGRTGTYQESLIFYTSRQLPVHRLCLFAHRFQWK